MQLLVYISPLNPLARDLLTAVGPIGTFVHSSHFTSLESLAGHLRLPPGGQSICILAPSNIRELKALINLGHLMRDLRIVLVLPDESTRMTREGHLLRPRFISHGKYGLAHVAAVVSRMAHRHMAKSVHPVIPRHTGLNIQP